MAPTSCPRPSRGAIRPVLLIPLLLAAFSPPAAATPVSIFSSGWTELAAEDHVAANGQVFPGFGGQNFDAEYLFYRRQGNLLAIGLQAGFDLLQGMVPYGHRTYYAGDLALSFDNTPSNYEYAVDFGLYTEDYQGDPVDADNDHDGYDQPGLYRVTGWNNDIYYTVSSPFAMDDGTRLDTLYGNSAGAEGESFYRIVTIALTSIAEIVPDQGFTLAAHWTMSCGNDAITGIAEVTPVPEPATIFLLGSGMAGLGSLLRRRDGQA